MTRQEAQEFIDSMVGKTNFTKEEIEKYRRALAVLANKWSIPNQ
jgi:hypothetical protein